MDIAKVINPNYHPLFRTLLDSLHHSVKINSICAKIGSCNQVGIKAKASCIQHSNFLMLAIMGEEALWCISAWTMTNDTRWWQGCAISPSLHSACRCVTEYLHLFTALSPLLLHNYYKQSDQKLCGNSQYLLLLLEHCSKMEIQDTRYNLEKKIPQDLWPKDKWSRKSVPRGNFPPEPR